MSTGRRYYLGSDAVLKLLEQPSVYRIREDELYELDDQAFSFLLKCSTPEGCAITGEAGFIDFCLAEGILGTEPSGFRRPPVSQSPIPSLRYLELQITDRCNLRCRHCYIGQSQDRELSVEQIRFILEDFEQLQGLRLLITGGEPLMHRCFGEINALLPRFSFRKVLFTNGLMLTPVILESLNVHEIQFSVDGMEKGHEALRGHGTYSAVLRAMKLAMTAGFPVSVSTMVHAANLGEFDEMQKLFNAVGVHEWTVDAPCPEGNLMDNRLLTVAPEVAGPYLEYGFGGGMHGGGEGYACGLHLASVTAAGSVCKCAFYAAMPAGNIGRGLEEAWRRILPVPLENLDCSAAGCGEIGSCRGGCRYRAQRLAGPGASGLERDFCKCNQYGIIINNIGHEARKDPMEGGNRQ